MSFSMVKCCSLFVESLVCQFEQLVNCSDENNRSGRIYYRLSCKVTVSGLRPGAQLLFYQDPYVINNHYATELRIDTGDDVTSVVLGPNDYNMSQPLVINGTGNQVQLTLYGHYPGHSVYAYKGNYYLTVLLHISSHE